MTKPALSNQLESRHWLTLLEATKHLSENGVGDGTEAYILRLALDGRIKLSVNFLKWTWANPCYVVPYDVENLKTAVANDIYPKELKWCETSGGFELASLPIGNGKFLNIQDKQWLSLRGLWDLPMIDGDWLAVEQKWRSLAEAPKTNPGIVYGVFLEGDDGIIYRLKDLFNFSEYQAMHEEKLKEQRRQNAINNLSKDNADLLLNLIEEDREIFLKKRLRSPVFSLPKDSFFVIRPKALIEFERNEQINTPERSIGSGTNVNQSENEQNPWLIADPRDPEPEQSWYIPARYFARQLVKGDPTLLTKRSILASKVALSLKNTGIKSSRGKSSLSDGTVLKAFSNVNFG